MNSKVIQHHVNMVNKLCGQLTKASSFSPSPSSVGVSPAVQKNLQTPCGQMTKFSRGESRAGVCFPAASPVVSPFLLPPLRAGLLWRGKVLHSTSPGLKSVTSDQALTPGWLTTPMRKNYLHHEWTCLLLKCHRDAWYLLHQSPLCIFNNPSLSQQYGMCRVLCFCAIYVWNTVKLSPTGHCHSKQVYVIIITSQHINEVLKRGYWQWAEKLKKTKTKLQFKGI